MANGKLHVFSFFSAVPDGIVLRYDDFSNVILNGYKTYVSCNPDGDGAVVSSSESSHPGRFTLHSMKMNCSIQI